MKRRRDGRQGQGSAAARVGLCVALGVLASLGVEPASAQSESEPHELSALRQLRRASLALTDQQPSVAQYEALLALPQEARGAAVEAAIEEMLDSEAFAAALVGWGHEYLSVSSYDERVDGGNWVASRAIQLEPCGQGTRHAGALGTFNGSARLGDPASLCDDAGAFVADIEPWWAPGTTVPVIGNAARETTEADGEDCGIAALLLRNVLREFEGCSCGPNLIYCARRDSVPYRSRGYDGSNHDLTAQRRSAFEEPARLLSHIVMNDRPFTDLVLGDYTVVNQGLYHMYQRAARQNPDNAWMDDVEWWRGWGDQAQWREVPFEELHPHLLADRQYRYDPRQEDEPPLGVPSAGVLTSLVSNTSFARERVRASRWLERLTCREFSPPPADVQFAPYQRDPGTEGVCQHCHQAIDPAAIHFKRFFDGGAYIAGIGPWQYDRLVSYSEARLRFENAFISDTLMTPVSAQRLEENPDARFIDFLPPTETLFGQVSDGTIGPLGFGKMIVASGEFDRCAVMRTYERFGGRELIRGQDEALIEELLAHYLSEGRNIRALIRHIFGRPAFKRGW